MKRGELWSEPYAIIVMAAAGLIILAILYSPPGCGEASSTIKAVPQSAMTEDKIRGMIEQHIENGCHRGDVTGWVRSCELWLRWWGPKAGENGDAKGE